MKPRRFGSHEFITIEGPDYNALRASEALARKEFCRPENLQNRREHSRILFPKADEVTLKPLAAETTTSRELL
jgi:hypothetical protein